MSNSLVAKPFLVHRPKPKRLPERKAVTIIAGFRCHQGIVICADTQETLGTAKREIPKVRFQARGLLTDEPLAVAFCGAGDGPLIDKLVDESWKAIEPLATMEDVSTAIEITLKRLYREYGEIYQAGACPTAELIYGVRTADGEKLFSATGPIVNEKPGYCSSGIGYYLADFLASRMYGYYLTLHQCVIVAAYVLFQVKKNVEGCGGESHIAILRENGMSGLIDPSRVDSLTKLLEWADPQFGSLLLSVADFDLSDDEFTKGFKHLAKMLLHERENTQGEIEENDRLTSLLVYEPGESRPQLDSFGLTPFPKKNEGT